MVHDIQYLVGGGGLEHFCFFPYVGSLIIATDYNWLIFFRVVETTLITTATRYMEVSYNRGTPQSSIWMRLSIINHPFRVALFQETPIWFKFRRSLFARGNWPRISEAWEGWVGLVPIESPVNNLSRETWVQPWGYVKRHHWISGKMVETLVI